MDNKWFVIYYESAEGKCPVTEFIDSRSKRNQAKILSVISFLEEIGPTLPRPLADLLEDGIHELRIKLSGNQIRILYFFCYKNIIVLTHAFPKTTDKTPKPEIKKAQKYREDFLQRFTETQLREIQNENL
jgi:phage-related protein